MLTLAHRMILGAASRPKNDANIVTLAGPSTQSDLLNDLARDTDGNRYVVGSGGSPSAAYVAKLAAGGGLVWQRKSALAVSTAFSSVALDQGAGAVYVCGSGRASGSIDAWYIVKYSTSGVLQWQRKITTTYSVSSRSVRVDGSGDVFALATLADTVPKLLLVKYSSGGVLQWQRVLSHGSDGLFSTAGMVIDASGNLMIASTRQISTSDRLMLWIKCDSSGVIQNQASLRMTSNGTHRGEGIAADASGNIYIAGSVYTASATRAAVCKLNSAGVVQWLKYVTSTAGFNQVFSLSLGSDGRLYATGLERVMVFQPSDGSLIWQRGLKGPTTGVWRSGVQLADSYLHFSGYVDTAASSNDGCVVALPDSGEGVGTYGGFITVSESTDTVTSASPTMSTPSFTDAAGSLTEAAGDLPDVAGDLTANTQAKTS